MKLGRMLVAMAMIATFAGMAMAANDIMTTSHNLSGNAWSQGQVCLPCHAPHVKSGHYLWNHELADPTAFTLHPDAAGNTLGDYSLRCLGCHDGVTAMDSFSGQTGSNFMAGSGLIGTDLSTQHPIGVTYPTSSYSMNTNFGTVWGSQDAIMHANGNLPIFHGQVECPTCHSPHSANDNFLRIVNTASNLCFVCHKK